MTPKELKDRLLGGRPGVIIPVKCTSQTPECLITGSNEDRYINLYNQEIDKSVITWLDHIGAKYVTQDIVLSDHPEYKDICDKLQLDPSHTKTSWTYEPLVDDIALCGLWQKLASDHFGKYLDAGISVVGFSSLLYTYREFEVDRYFFEAPDQDIRSEFIVVNSYSPPLEILYQCDIDGIVDIGVTHECVYFPEPTLSFDVGKDNPSLTGVDFNMCGEP